MLHVWPYTYIIFCVSEQRLDRRWGERHLAKWCGPRSRHVRRRFWTCPGRALIGGGAGARRRQLMSWLTHTAKSCAASSIFLLASFFFHTSTPYKRSAAAKSRRILSESTIVCWAFGIDADQWATAAQDEGEWCRTAEEGAEHFMVKWIAAEEARTGLRHAVEWLKVTGIIKERIAQSKRARAGSHAFVD